MTPFEQENWLADDPELDWDLWREPEAPRKPPPLDHIIQPDKDEPNLTGCALACDWVELAPDDEGYDPFECRLEDFDFMLRGHPRHERNFLHGRRGTREGWFYSPKAQNVSFERGRKA